jgi:hypothetical protein
MLRSAIKLTLLLGALTVASSITVASDVYKYTDEKGNVLYTDKPRTLPAERLNVQTAKVDPAAQAKQAEELKRMQDADEARKQTSAQQSSQAGATTLNAKDRADRCSKARDKYTLYTNSRKLYEEQPGGERHYLTSEELDAARASAKATMDSWCK